MNHRKPVLLSWSGGKDSTLTLAALRDSPDWRVVGLLTTITSDHDRISMHGVRTSLLHLQAAALGLPLRRVDIPVGATDSAYAERMGQALEIARSEGVAAVAFGDLFLRDVRRYREEMLAQVGMSAIFPIWGAETSELARTFIESGYRATITCADTEQIPENFAGRDFDLAMLGDLPDAADPCGENGEFHTFVHTGPIFRRAVPCRRGERVLRDGRFMYQDLV
ncbi:MAG: ATP-binding protein [Gemmatimonas sp.]|nr:ATP-binding protein [Gemmatimonas sp.]